MRKVILSACLVSLLGFSTSCNKEVEENDFVNKVENIQLKSSSFNNNDVELKLKSEGYAYDFNNMFSGDFNSLYSYKMIYITNSIGEKMQLVEYYSKENNTYFYATQKETVVNSLGKVEYFSFFKNEKIGSINLTLDDKNTIVSVDEILVDEEFSQDFINGGWFDCMTDSYASFTDDLVGRVFFMVNAPIVLNVMAVDCGVQEFFN